LVEADGLLTLDVRWQYAEAVQAYLHKHGIGSTLHLDPATGAARLEVWPDCSATVVRGLLTRWRG
jgi:hypothetical protein